jgi:hypothetical protein
MMRALELGWNTSTKVRERSTWLKWLQRESRLLNQRSLVKLIQAANKLLSVLHVVAVPLNWSVVLEVAKYLDRSGALDTFPAECKGLEVVLGKSLFFLWAQERADFATELDFIERYKSVIKQVVSYDQVRRVWLQKPVGFKGVLSTLTCLVNSSKFARSMFTTHITTAMATYVRHFMTKVFDRHVVSTLTVTRASLKRANDEIDIEMERLEAARHLPGDREIVVEWAQQSLRPTAKSVVDEKSFRESVAIKHVASYMLPPIPMLAQFVVPTHTGTATIDEDLVRGPLEARTKLQDFLTARPPTSVAELAKLLADKKKVLLQVGT